MTQQGGKIIDEFSYEEKDMLGKGQFGFVFLGKNRNTNEIVAVKQVPKALLANPYLWNLLSNEINALSKLNSPNIVKFVAMKETPKNFYIVTEFCDSGDLSKMTKKGMRHPEEQVIDILAQLCEGFREMKRYNIIHRDIKPANIMIHQGKIKIGDLGFAKSVADFNISMATSMVGSPLYMSPQLLKHEKYTSKCDIWSIGIILYQLLFGRSPWHALDMSLLLTAILEEPLQFPDDVPNVSSEMKDVITKCLQLNEGDRISWDELFEHDIFKRKTPVHLIPPLSPAMPITTEATISVQKPPHSPLLAHPEGQNPPMPYSQPQVAPKVHLQQYKSEQVIPTPQDKSPSPAPSQKLQNQRTAPVPPSYPQKQLSSNQLLVPSPAQNGFCSRPPVSPYSQPTAAGPKLNSEPNIMPPLSPLVSEKIMNSPASSNKKDTPTLFKNEKPRCPPIIGRSNSKNNSRNNSRERSATKISEEKPAPQISGGHPSEVRDSARHQTAAPQPSNTWNIRPINKQFSLPAAAPGRPVEINTNKPHPPPLIPPKINEPAPTAARQLPVTPTGQAPLGSQRSLEVSPNQQKNVNLNPPPAVSIYGRQNHSPFLRQFERN